MKNWIAIGVAGLAALLWANESQAYYWQSANNCWQDFDVSGGWFCGLRMSACSDGGLKCVPRVPLQLSQTIPAPASKHVALDQQARIYLVGNDNKIYWDNGGISSYPFQSPATCIKKLVVGQGSFDTDQTMLVMDCNNTVYSGHAGSWVVQSTGVRDISKGSFNNSVTFYMLTSNGTLWSSLLHSPATAAIGWSNLGSTDFYWQFQGRTAGPAISNRIGGPYRFLDTVSTCHNDNSIFPPGLFVPTFGSGLMAGETNSGCDFLTLPRVTNSYDGNFSPIVQKVTYAAGGPGTTFLWVLTNTTRVYALSTTPTGT